MRDEMHYSVDGFSTFAPSVLRRARLRRASPDPHPHPARGTSVRSRESYMRSKEESKEEVLAQRVETGSKGKDEREKRCRGKERTRRWEVNVQRREEGKKVKRKRERAVGERKERDREGAGDRKSVV